MTIKSGTTRLSSINEDLSEIRKNKDNIIKNKNSKQHFFNINI